MIGALEGREEKTWSLIILTDPIKFRSPKFGDISLNLPRTIDISINYSVASFLVLGKGQDPKVPTEEKKNSRRYMWLTCTCSSETHIFRYQNTCYICMHAYTMNAVSFYYFNMYTCTIVMGIRRINDSIPTKHQHWENLCVCLEIFSHFHSSKTDISFNILMVLQNFSDTLLVQNDMFVGLHVTIPINFQMTVPTNSKKLYERMPQRW